MPTLRQFPAPAAPPHLATRAPGHAAALHAAAASLTLLSLWGLAHRYRGLGFDAQLYAFQALARIHPSLSQDLFLLNASQERYTWFSPVYAVFIRWLGVERAALLLYVTCAAIFAATAWLLMRRLAGTRLAWLSVGLMIVTMGSFGAFHVLHYQEDFLTARSAAEALVLTALALNAHGHRVVALTALGVAMAFHPIMALPGLLVLACLWLPWRVSLSMAGLGILAAFAASLAACLVASVQRHLPLLDTHWLYLVRERSQYLLLDLWTLEDWNLNAKPLVTLVLTALAVEDARMRRLAQACLVVSAVGIAVSAVGCAIGPIALLVQAQTWRLVWLAALFAVLLLPSTLCAVLRDRRIGWLCCVCIGLAWTLPAVDGLWSASLAVLIYGARNAVPAAAAPLLRGLAIAALAAACLWMLHDAWTALQAAGAKAGEPIAWQRLSGDAAMHLPIVLLGWLALHLLEQLRSVAAYAAWGGALLLGLAFLLPAAFRQALPLSTVYSRDEYADWRQAIPADRNVVIASRDSASLFAWFVLERANYLSEAQSAGVVFSRDTAVEVERRSDWLAPLMDPTWKIFSAIAQYAKNPRTWRPPGVHPLTPASLLHVCGDPKLDFVIAREKVDARAITHAGAGPWMNWNLYDCAPLRAGEWHAPGG